MLLTKAEQVSDDGGAPLDYACTGHGARVAALPRAGGAVCPRSLAARERAYLRTARIRDVPAGAAPRRPSQAGSRELVCPEAA
jgi:hypothetical protein